jgi:hypothetical protein
MKRVVTNVGDVFVTSRGEYLQLVAIDQVQLGGDVVVYYGRVGMDQIPDVPIKFYHHNTVSQGVKMGLWKKAGRRPLPDLSKLVFKQYFGEDLEIHDYRHPLIRRIFKMRPYWATWTPIDEKWKKISYKKGLRLTAEDGGVGPATDLDYRIKHGVSSFKTNWPSS